jgi:anaerobic selenocysteine-containing dehydrogenase
VAEPPDADYPLILTTGRRRPGYHTGTQTGRAAGFDLLIPHEQVEVSREDAADLGLVEDEQVDVISRRGRVRVAVTITDRSPKGLVFLGFHFPQHVLTNLLTTDAYDPVTETPEFKACAVRIEKAS